jgi:hypothetical protein
MCDCNKLTSKNNKKMVKELQKSICILKSHIYTLRIAEKLKLDTICNVIIPCDLLALVKNILQSDSYCDNNKCDCNTNVSIHPNVPYIIEIKNNPLCSVMSNKCTPCQIKICDIAFYCDPFSMNVLRLKKKDIIPLFNYENHNTFLNSVRLTISKYEGFVNMFNKIIESLSDD